MLECELTARSGGLCLRRASRIPARARGTGRLRVNIPGGGLLPATALRRGSLGHHPSARFGSSNVLGGKVNGSRRTPFTELGD